MENQPSAINFSQAWSGGTRNACSLYTTFRKIERRYINPIIDDIKQVSKDLSGKRIFKPKPRQCKPQIMSIISKVDEFTLSDLKVLLEKEYTTIDFLCKVYEIKKRNTKEYSIRRGRAYQD
tara:strand:+ start:16 stop:378 length:363 start_codon:yes stop_codon:yes gene_type:complete